MTPAVPTFSEPADSLKNLQRRPCRSLFAGKRRCVSHTDPRASRRGEQHQVRCTRRLVGPAHCSSCPLPSDTAGVCVCASTRTLAQWKAQTSSSQSGRALGAADPSPPTPGESTHARVFEFLRPHPGFKLEEGEGEGEGEPTFPCSGDASDRVVRRQLSSQFSVLGTQYPVLRPPFSVPIAEPYEPHEPHEPYLTHWHWHRHRQETLLLAPHRLSTRYPDS